MIDNRVRDIIEELNEMLVREIPLERELGFALRAMNDDTRTEVAFLMQDLLNGHPNKPSNVTCPLQRVEKYIGHAIRVADWRVACDDLLDELDDLNDATLNGDLRLIDDCDAGLEGCETLIGTPR